jgi:hypothetical protein
VKIDENQLLRFGEGGSGGSSHELLEEVEKI